ncbi:hypothetical protein G6F56_011043 [Rhizopus delemar]|nr:hypothetical protein G6F56_011043 [Rhizopus delemar]
MVLSNKINSVPRGAPSDPPHQSSSDLNHNNTNDLHSSPTLSFAKAAKGTLTPSAPRVVQLNSSVTLNLNCRPSAAATSAPTYISIVNDPLNPTTPVVYKTGSSNCSVI